MSASVLSERASAGGISTSANGISTSARDISTSANGISTSAVVPSAPSGILCVGLTCVDLVSVVTSYPAEDSDNRCLRQYWSRGGNASNNATVLALLGEKKVACLRSIPGFFSADAE